MSSQNDSVQPLADLTIVHEEIASWYRGTDSIELDIGVDLADRVRAILGWLARHPEKQSILGSLSKEKLLDRADLLTSHATVRSLEDLRDLGLDGSFYDATQHVSDLHSIVSEESKVLRSMISDAEWTQLIELSQTKPFIDGEDIARALRSENEGSDLAPSLADRIQALTWSQRFVVYHISSKYHFLPGIFGHPRWGFIKPTIEEYVASIGE